MKQPGRIPRRHAHSERVRGQFSQAALTSGAGGAAAHSTIRRGADAVDYTLAHIVRFQIAKLREYEARLRADRNCSIKWDYLRAGKIDQPHRVEELQLADIAASAIAAAFECDRFGNTEPRYLIEMAPRLYRQAGNLTSYGLKMHPWNA